MAALPMLARERRAVTGLATIFGLRLLGMYMVLPVLALHAEGLKGATGTWIGWSVGAYGLSQGLLQLPMGALGDRFGRRRIIAIGLLMFSVGSIVCARAETLQILVLGRLLQGAGGIASTLVALVADLTRPEVRARGMASIGTAVALSFGVGMVIGPSLAARFGVPSLFWLMAVLSALGGLYVMIGVPAPSVRETLGDAYWHHGDLPSLLRSGTMLRLTLGVFALQAMTTSLFVIGPGLLRLHLKPSLHGLVYLGLIPVGLLLMYFGSRRADRSGRLRDSVLLASVLLFASGVLMALGARELIPLVAAIGLTVGGVALAEPAMPAMLSCIVKPDLRGKAAGLYHTFEFIGSFCGAWLAGMLITQPTALGIVLSALALLWLGMAWGLPRVVETVASVPKAQPAKAGAQRARMASSE